MHRIFSIVVSVLSAFWMTLAIAQVEVSHAWARATVAGQKNTAVYMSMHANEELKLSAVSSPVATKTELHTTIKEGNTVRMRTVPEFLLHKGEALVLQPGSYHVMLQGLMHQLNSGDVIPLALKFVRSDGTKVEQELKVNVLKTSVAH